MTLVARGKAQLDAVVAPILQFDCPKICEGTTTGPTIRQLLNMTGGIPHGAVTYTDRNAAAQTNEQRISCDQALVVFPPGKVFHYSNFSIALVDRVIEKVSGEAFGHDLSRAIFRPLGMRQGFVDSTTSGHAGEAVRYDDKGKRVGTIYTFPRSSRGIYSSLNDLLAYASFHLRQLKQDQARILNDAEIDMLHNSRSDVPGAYIALGMGSIDLLDGTHWVISDGQDMGAQSTLSLIPARNIGIVCLTNVTADQADEVSFRVTDVLVPGFASQAKAFRQSHEAAFAPFKPTTDWLGEWRGAIKTASGDLGIIMNFRQNADVRIAIDGQYPTILDEPRFGYGLLSGAFLGKLSLEEKPNHYHRIELGLRLDHDRLYGFAFANFENAKGHFELPTCIALQRAHSASK